MENLRETRRAENLIEARPPVTRSRKPASSAIYQKPAERT